MLVNILVITYAKAQAKSQFYGQSKRERMEAG